MASSMITEFSHLQIPLEDVLNATNNFHRDNKIGHGGLGSAYKGQLQRSGKSVKISALRLYHNRGESLVQFWTEISMLSNLNHTNIVSIIGFCDEKDEKVIVTTYADKGSLEKHLNNPNLTWTQRLKICLGVARALSYLHHDEARGYGVIHININSCSILVDKNWEPKLSGFKVSVKQSLDRMDRVILSEPIGTKGYIDPEFEKAKGFTHKSDIYSFGVVLFELLCGRKAYVENESNRFLARLAKYHYKNETLQDIIHPDLRSQMSPYSLRIYSKMAYSCLEKEGEDRPSILIIIDKLEKALKQALKFKPHFGKNLEKLKIQLIDIKSATNNFSDKYKTASNEYYTWYEGVFGHFVKQKPLSIQGESKSEPTMRHKNVVIKRFLPEDDEQEEELFFNELEMLTTVKHRNIVNLLGFCVEGYDMLLVTEELSNGYLISYLNDVNKMSTLTWERRLKICIDVARAINYIHFEMKDKKIIIHGQINTYCIGFNENWEAKIEDFECAVFLPPNQKEVVYKRKQEYNSIYHVDPKYTMTDKLKTESDVYSFGVILFEMVCGRHARHQIYYKKDEKGVTHLAKRMFIKIQTKDIDPALKEETGLNSFVPNRGANMHSLRVFLKVANQCVAEKQDERPTMKVVLNELEKSLLYQVSVSQEKRVQQPDKVVKELEIATPEKQVQQLENDQVNKEPEIESHDIPVHLKKLEYLKIHLSDIKNATDDFSDTYIITSVDSYTLYSAKLDHFDKEKLSSIEGTVVIKRYPSSNHEIYTKERFFTEIEILSTVKNPYIVTLFGFCYEGSEMILVTENISNGYLDDYLGNVDQMRTFTWEKRLKFCIDVAHALRYLHYEMEDRKVIINRDIYCCNIGVDQNLGAKIVEFFSSIFLPPNQEDEAIYVEWIGRPCYIDPEYKLTNKLKRESDVYSFGVVLFEILCGKTSFDPIYLEEDEGGLAYVARRCYYLGTLYDIIDPTIREENSDNNSVINRRPNKDSLDTFIEIAYRCVANTQDQRPTMKEVVKELEKAYSLQNNKMSNPRISLEDIKVATQNFNNDNFIGVGGFGRVFKGELPNGDAIVAKRSLDTGLGGEQQFWNELQILSEYEHENVIGLIGFCDEKDEKVIVYEYAPKGSLDRYLNDGSLTWEKRLIICIDIASALYFLHGGVGKQAKVIHRDIKSANILLNHEWKAKLGDFGLSLISPINQKTKYVIDYVSGTQGYVDPLYEKSRFLTIESDIYSFGVVLFEIMCGRSTFEIKKHKGHYMADFIKESFEKGKLDEAVFKEIREQIVQKSLTTFKEISYQCLDHEREKRPTIKKVLMELEKALEFQVNGSPRKNKKKGRKGKKKIEEQNSLG